MKFLIFADLHAHKWKRHSKPMEPDGRNDRLMDTVNVLKAIQRGIKKHEVDSVIFLGDLFHQRGEIDVETWNTIVPELRYIGELAPKDFYLLMGNHDMAVATLSDVAPKGIYTSLTEIATDSENIHIISSTGWKIGEEYAYLFLPYVADNEELVASLDEFMRTTFDRPVVVFTHIGIREAEAQKGIRLRNALDSNFFGHPMIKGVFSGHYHIPQKFKISDVPFWYVGATHQHNWGDAGQDRGYIIWDSETFKVKRINLNCAPKFVVIEEGESSGEDSVKGNFIKRIVPAGAAQDAIDKLKTHFIDTGARDVTIERERISQEKHEDPPALGDTTISSLGVAKSYVDRQGFKPKKAANLITLGNEILEKAAT